jgi:hypothetical protein
MKAMLKRLDLNSATAFETFQPSEAERFGLWLHAGAGMADTDAADDFRFFVCNDAWLSYQRELGIACGARYLLIDGPFDASTVKAQLEAFLESCVGESWDEVVAAVSKVGLWEFEDYQP